MSSEQMPPEFEWIKPGVNLVELPSKEEYKCISHPFFTCGDWVCDVDVDGYIGRVLCSKAQQKTIDSVSAISLEPITLNITREQAEALLKGLNTGYLEDGLKMAEIKKQIEEKLK